MSRRKRLYYAAHRSSHVPRVVEVPRLEPVVGPVDHLLLRPGWVEECRLMARSGRALGAAFYLLGLCIEAEAERAPT